MLAAYTSNVSEEMRVETKPLAIHSRPLTVKPASDTHLE